MSLIMNDIANDVKDTILYCTPERIHNTLWVEITVNVEKERRKKSIRPSALWFADTNMGQNTWDGTCMQYIFIQK